MNKKKRRRRGLFRKRRYRCFFSRISLVVGPFELAQSVPDPKHPVAGANADNEAAQLLVAAGWIDWDAAALRRLKRRQERAIVTSSLGPVKYCYFKFWACQRIEYMFARCFSLEI